jgi:hypothetical protein
VQPVPVAEGTAEQPGGKARRSLTPTHQRPALSEGVPSDSAIGGPR